MLLANHVVSDEARKEALGMAEQQAGRLGATDSKRSYRVDSVGLDGLIVLGQAYPNASVDTTMPLLLEERTYGTEKRLFLSGAQTTAPQMNSIALLDRLKAGGAKTWPAVVFSEIAAAKSASSEKDFEKLLKDSTDESDDSYRVPHEDQAKFKAELVAFILALLQGTKLLADKTAFDAAMEGARFAGGGLSLAQIESVAHKVGMSQTKYLNDFEETFRQRISAIAATSFSSEAAFDEALEEGIFNAASSRAERYAVGAGQPAWREGATRASMANGVEGATWVCTFAPTTCTECISLHGRWFTWADLEEIWGNTICNGQCLCGVVPCDDPDEAPPSADEEELPITAGG